MQQGFFTLNFNRESLHNECENSYTAGKFRYFTGVPITPVYRPFVNPLNPGYIQNLPAEHLQGIIWIYVLTGTLIFLTELLSYILIFKTSIISKFLKNPGMISGRIKFTPQAISGYCPR